MKCFRGVGSAIACVLTIAFGLGLLTALLFQLRFIVLVASVAIIILGLVALCK